MKIFRFKFKIIVNITFIIKIKQIKVKFRYENVIMFKKKYLNNNI